MSKQKYPNVTLEHEGLTIVEAEEMVQQAAQLLQVNVMDLDDVRYASRAFIQVRWVAGLATIYSVVQNRLGLDITATAEPGKSIYGKVIMRTPENGNTSGFGQHWYNRSFSSPEEATKTFNQMVAKLKKEG